MKYILIIHFLTGHVYEVPQTYTYNDCVVAASFEMNFSDDVQSAECEPAGEEV